MGLLEERVAVIEGRMLEQVTTFEAIRRDIADLGRRMDDLGRRMDQRFVQIDQRFAQIDQRFAQMDQKMSTQFYWVLGVQMTMFASMIATILVTLLRS